MLFRSGLHDLREYRLPHRLRAGRRRQSGRLDEPHVLERRGEPYDRSVLLDRRLHGDGVGERPVDEAIGDEVSIDVRGRSLAAEIVKLPMVAPHVK